ncbi:hypothetical protein SAMN02746062_02021 [Alysiella filiformis DSM 16848]|uniref:Uncharacterized protein n=1 Tax=Alysiella filiformis DSM 16848 TaxID=1120981 RepID=A0A286EHA2_9NEIS|nr:hypothetical protein SAMN02746062_02021 [Alysiella filiformis DSM 16848]
MRVNATHWRVFLTQKLAILMKKQSRNELSLAPYSTRHFLILPQTCPLPLCKGEGTGFRQPERFLSCTERLPETCLQSTSETNGA